MICKYFEPLRFSEVYRPENLGKLRDFNTACILSDAARAIFYDTFFWNIKKFIKAVNPFAQLLMVSQRSPKNSTSALFLLE